MARGDRDWEKGQWQGTIAHLDCLDSTRAIGGRSAIALVRLNAIAVMDGRAIAVLVESAIADCLSSAIAGKAKRAIVRALATLRNECDDRFRSMEVLRSRCAGRSPAQAGSGLAIASDHYYCDQDCDIAQHRVQFG